MVHKVLGARVLEKAIQLLFSFETNIPEQSLFELSRKLQISRRDTSSERRIEKVPKFAEAFDASDASDNYRSKKVIVGTGAGQETRSRV